MLWSFCSSKGGVGTSVVAAAFAGELARTSGDQVVLVDFCGAQPDICGLAAADAPGVVDWLLSSSDVGVDALENLLIEVAPGLAILPRGSQPLPRTAGQIDPDRIGMLIAALVAMEAVADIGVVDLDPLSPTVLLVAGSQRTVTVVRSCYLGLRELGRLPVVVDLLVEVVEAGRALRTLDIEAVAGVPVHAKLRVDPAIARSVDAGRIIQRPPRALRRLAQDLRSTHAEMLEPVGIGR